MFDLQCDIFHVNVHNEFVGLLVSGCILQYGCVVRGSGCVCDGLSLNSREEADLISNTQFPVLHCDTAVLILGAKKLNFHQ